MRTVKNILVFIWVIILFEGCKKDDPAPNAALLKGVWEEVSFVASGCTDPNDNENYNCTSGCEILVITPNTLTIEGDEYDYTVSGNKITISLGGDTEIVTFDVTETTLTITSQDSPADGNCKNVSTYKRYDNTVTDIDGNVYNTVFIGTQEWMQENLKTTHYSDGSAIPNVTQASDWVNLSTGAYCNFDNNVNNVAIYGRLYNGYAVTDSRNVCPSGWHVPSLDDVDILIDKLGGENVAGGKMKSTTALWTEPSIGATNESWFTGLPAGTRFDAGDFRDLLSFAHWRTTSGWSIRLQHNHTMVEKFYFYTINGTSVRCVKN